MALARIDESFSSIYSSLQQVEVAWRRWGLIVPRPEASGHLRGEDITLGARAHGGLQGAAYVGFVAELPKTASGKILWRQLQEDENRRTAMSA